MLATKTAVAVGGIDVSVGVGSGVVDGAGVGVEGGGDVALGVAAASGRLQATAEKMRSKSRRL